jgi:hypothetical protein
MPYAKTGTVSSTYTDGCIEITEKQYQQAIDEICKGNRVVVNNGKMVFRSSEKVKAYSVEDKTEIEVYKDDPVPQGYTHKEPISDTHVWHKGKWVKDDDTVKKELIERIDNAVAEHYSELTRFHAEYTLKEADALSFYNQGCIGEPPALVLAYAEHTGLTVNQATDRILTKAREYRVTIEKLGQLRSRKNDVKKTKTAQEADAVCDSILKDIEAVIAETKEV